MSIAIDTTFNAASFADDILTFVINQVAYPIFVHNAAEEIIYANDAYLKKALENREAVYGKKYYHFYPKLQASLENYLVTPKNDTDPDNVLLITINQEHLCHVGFSICNSKGVHQFSLRMLSELSESLTA